MSTPDRSAESPRDSRRENRHYEVNGRDLRTATERAVDEALAADVSAANAAVASLDQPSFSAHLASVEAIANEELDALDALAAAATPGPWWATEDLDGGPAPAIGVAAGGPPYRSMVVTTPGAATYDAGERTNRVADAHFIANARHAVPRLVAEVRRLRSLELRLR